MNAVRSPIGNGNISKIAGKDISRVFRSEYFAKLYYVTNILLRTGIKTEPIAWKKLYQTPNTAKKIISEWYLITVF